MSVVLLNSTRVCGIKFGRRSSSEHAAFCYLCMHIYIERVSFLYVLKMLLPLFGLKGKRVSVPRVGFCLCVHVELHRCAVHSSYVTPRH